MEKIILFTNSHNFTESVHGSHYDIVVDAKTPGGAAHRFPQCSRSYAWTTGVTSGKLGLGVIASCCPAS